MRELIELVLFNPILYDTNHLHYKNKIQKEETWFKIATELGEEAIVVKKKWKNLRDSYLKHLKGERYRYWEWAKYMKPFQPYLRTSTPFNIKDYEETDCRPDLPFHLFEETESLANETDCSTSKSKSDNEVDEYLQKKKKVEHKKAKLRDDIESCNSSSNKCKKYFHIETSAVDKLKRKRNMQKVLETSRRHYFDATDHMFLAFAKTIKDFPMQRQLEVKHEIANIIMRNERENLCQEPQNNEKQIVNDDNYFVEEFI